MLGADHSTSEGGGGGGDFEKKYPASAYAQEKHSCTRPSCQKKFMHVQWAGKKILARCSLS